MRRDAEFGGAVSTSTPAANLNDSMREGMKPDNLAELGW